MSYCTIEEAWGTNSLKGKKVNRKKKTHTRQVYYNENNENNNYNDYNDYKEHSSEFNYNLGNSRKRGMHNKLSRKNRFKKKNIQNKNMNLQVKTSNESRRLVDDKPPSPMFLNDNDYDNYQEIEHQPEENNKLNEYNNSHSFSRHDDDLEKINNSEFMPSSAVMDNISPYNDLEDNYHEQGNYGNLSNYENNDVIDGTNGNDDNGGNDDNDGNDNDGNDVYSENNYNDEIGNEKNNNYENVNEGYQNQNMNDIDNVNLKTIMDRLDNLERMIHQKKKDNNNVHDIILFIIIGIFILFALDSIFKIGKNTI